MQTSQTIPIAIVLGGAIVALAVYVTLQSKQPSLDSGSGNPTAVRPVDTADHTLGNPAAPIKIIEYSDFDCAYCKVFDATLRQVMADVGTSGKVAWVFRHYPLTELHPNAFDHARAAACAEKAGGSDGFWKFTAALFENQPTDPADYGVLAKATGVPATAFATCMQNAATTVDARIRADIENAIVIGARGTPYTLLVAEGQTPIVIRGAYPYADVKDAVEAMLANVSL